eukprot:1812517-Heterocapsa_arctica.AAC.1
MDAPKPWLKYESAKFNGDAIASETIGGKRRREFVEKIEAKMDKYWEAKGGFAEAGEAPHCSSQCGLPDSEWRSLVQDMDEV